jgi:hypothetical protein
MMDFRVICCEVHGTGSVAGFGVSNVHLSGSAITVLFVTAVSACTVGR